MAKKEPIRRNDVIRCENCGEDYAITYKRCPFCDDTPLTSGSTGGVTGRRVANNRRGGGYGGPVNPIQIIMLVVSLILIIAAAFIVFNSVSSLFNRPAGATSSGSEDSSSIISSSEEPSSGSEDPGSSSEQSPISSSIPDDEPEVTVTSITLNHSDLTLSPNETQRLTAQVSPASAAGSILWTSSNESAATVTDDGTVVNVNETDKLVKVTITASCGDKSAECTIYCRGGSSGDVTAESIGTVTGADSGLKIRSGPGTNYPAQDSATNGAKLTILGDAGDGWYKVRYNAAGGKTQIGYVSKDYVTID